MYKISFCDENREKRNASAGSGNTKSLRGAVINQTGTHFYLCHIANLRILCHEKTLYFTFLLLP